MVAATNRHEKPTNKQVLMTAAAMMVENHAIDMKAMLIAMRTAAVFILPISKNGKNFGDDETATGSSAEMAHVHRKNTAIVKFTEIFRAELHLSSRCRKTKRPHVNFGVLPGHRSM